MIDLHVHTRISDGTLNPYDLFIYAKNRGIDLLAIADHETILHFNEYKEDAKKVGIKLINAIEINVSDYKNFHLVGYGLVNLDFIEQYLQSIRMKNIKICIKVLEKINQEFGISFKPEDVVKYNHDGVLDKKAIAKILIKKGYASDVKSAYDLYIGPKAKAYIPINKITAKMAINLTHACGGIVSWAHPSTIRKLAHGNEDNHFTKDEIKHLVKELKIMGLDCLECYTSKTTKEESLFYLELAKQNSLAVSGGSDFHDHFQAEKIGCAELTSNHLFEIENKIKLANNNYNKKNIFNIYEKLGVIEEDVERSF